VATTRTDDRGEFRLGGLPEGRYLIAVDATTILLGPDGHPLDGPIPLTTMIDGRPLTFASDTASPVTRLYFPGTTTFADAQPIAVAKGEERTSVDVLVPAAVAPMTVNQLIADRAAADRGVPESYRASIRGRIVTADGRPLPQTRVSASSDDYPGRLTPSATTDADGRYELTRLPAGRYRVAASHAGYLTVAYGQQVPDDDSETVLLAAGASRDRVDITLQRPGIIAGRVVDDAGDPVEGAYIRVLRTKYESGQRRFVEVVGEGLHRTDDQGRYRVYGLRPGDYRVSAIAGQVVPLQAAADVPGYAPTYFPGTADPAWARVLSVDLDQQMLGVDIVLAARPTARVSGTALDADGKPVEGGMVLMPSRRSGALAPVPFDARTSSDGSFEFPNVPPGDYVLQVSKMRPNSYTEGEFAVRFVRVDGGDVDGLAVRTTKGSRVTGRIALDGTASPDFFGAIDLRAVPIDPDRSPLAGHLPVSADLARDLTFRMAGLSGPRVFRLRDAPRGWMLKAVLLNGRDIVDTPTDFGADEQSIADLEVVLSQQGAEIAGTVADNRGRPLSGRTVVVFSADRQLWTPPSRYVASAKSGRNGGFLLPALPAGEYRAAAVDRLGDGDWQDPDVLARFAAEAVRFAASPGQRVAVLLSPLGR
jgi:protocatechuate 3,4-dioxygenase beta subunit